MNPATQGAPAQSMKVYISADMEGVAGVVGREQLGPQGFEFSQFRKFMTGEVNAAIEAARDEGAVVKWHCSHTSGRTLMPEAAQALIREKVRAGLRRRGELNPFRIEAPLTLDLTYKNDQAAELIAYLPNVERIDNHRVRFVGSIVDISMFIEMALGYPRAMA